MVYKLLTKTKNNQFFGGFLHEKDFGGHSELLKNNPEPIDIIAL